MVSTDDLILKFDNTTESPLFIVIDPPCMDYELEPGQSLRLKIVGYKSSKDDVSNLLDIRYSTQNVINIDVHYNFKLVIIIANEEEVIWGF